MTADPTPGAPGTGQKIAEEDIGYCGALVRDGDRDRFITAMLAPAHQRAHLFALYAFNLELARVVDIVSEPMLGQIRYQWWREAVDEIAAGRPRRHQGVIALAETVAVCGIDCGRLQRLIDAREAEIDGDQPDRLEDLSAYIRDTAGAVAGLAAAVAGADDRVQDCAVAAGTAYGLVGAMRAVPHHLSRRRILVPRDLAARHGVDPRDLSEARGSAALNAVIRDVCAAASGELSAVRGAGLSRATIRPAFPAFAHATLADAYLKRLKAAGYNPFDPSNARLPALYPLSLIARRLLGRP